MAHITIPDQDLAERYTVGGVATDTFSYAKKFINESDVSVYNGTSLIDPADYTITGTPDASGVGFDGASIVLDTPVTNTIITLILEAPNKRRTDFPTTGPFNIAQLNTELDQQIILTQQLQTELDRAFLLPIDTSLTRIVLPDPTANMAFGWDATAENIINLQSIGTYKGTDATITTSDYTARDLVKSTTAGELNNVYIALQDSPAGTLLTNGSYWALVVDAVSAATSATNAATSEANAATSESNAATSESNAATSASNAATQATNSANSATQAALSATNAGNSETNASASETAAATSETNAATSATQASTSAGNSATSATAASASETAAATSETAAATSETNAAASYAATVAIYGSTSDVQNAVDSATASATSASSSATNASNSATAAATSEANAATNATAAQTAQTAAEAAQAAAESAQEAIEGTYLGAHASDPTVDGNGDAVTTGDWYFNTTDSQAYIYNGSSWDALAPDLVGDATPQLGGDLDTNGNDITFGDNVKANFGAGNDLQIYHDGSHSYIEDQGTGNLRIRGTDITLQDASGNGYISMVDGGAGGTVYLKHLGSNVLTTTSTGIDVTGTVTADGLTGDVTGDLTGDVTGDLTGESTLPAISTDITDTAVDVFVYDTRKDSDGGAWRKRTQHTSWYNETLNTSTRGSRKEFPAVAVIVAETDTVTIYDGDDPSLPMWAVFNGGTGYWLGYTSTRPLTSVAFNNGCLVVTQSTADGGAYVVDFIKDTGRFYITAGIYGPDSEDGIVNRHGGLMSTAYDTSVSIVNRAVNDVAMTVLPNAPIDDATGLPVPTIAVATDGGVSVIKDDGTVVDITSTGPDGSKVERVSFTSDNEIFAVTKTNWDASYDEVGILSNIPSSDRAQYQFGWDRSYNPAFGGSVFGGMSLGLATSQYRFIDRGIPTYSNGLAVEAPDFGVVLVDENKTASNKGMTATIASDYNTGWMAGGGGNTKLATLSDTDDTDVTGSELVTNGTFDSDTSGWTETDANNHVTPSYNSGALRMTATTTTTSAVWMGQNITGLDTSKTYVVSADIAISGTATASVILHDPYIASFPPITSSGNYSFTFSPTSTSHEVRALVNAGFSFGSTVDFDNISVRLAEEDRSVNGNGLQVFGTVTKSPVATGADLVAYSGFSASNYLEAPYNSDLDFGTGDFCVMGWVKEEANSATEVIISREGPSGAYYHLVVLADGTLRCRINNGSNDDLTSSLSIDKGIWTHVVFVRFGGVTGLYINGVLDVSGTSSQDVDNGAATLNFGQYYAASSPLLNGSLALLRISATALTAEQIRKIYEDEKVLFQENAKATLYGSSDAVTALAYDDDTNLLHVGTSAGRSDFQGLRRVDNTTTAVGAAISASNGLIAED